MKTNRVYALTENATIELGFQKQLDYPNEIWLRLCQKQCPNDKIIKIVDANKHHICKYCGGIANGLDDNVLCEECRDDFGHAFFSEL